MYFNEIDEMHQKLAHKQPALVNRKGPIILHSNVGQHVSMIIRQKLQALGYETLDYPPYSPDLSPKDYHIFKQLDNFLQDKCFRNLRNAETAFNEFVASRIAEYLLKLMVLILDNKVRSIQGYTY
ncbi:histone-lysine N-methyltransferase SETMAR [Trichonephila clavipes]|nr:histone-lysine N-methyltransferase SETMAR [Trichonephila clavipes]